MMNKSTNRSSDIIDAKLEEHQLCGSKQCPGCGHKFEGKPDWVGLPAGVKFDPTDQELIEHLEAKVEAKDLKSHPLIDEFIPTIEGEDGICYTHPEKLPGVTRDGLSRHFFHRPSKAYTTGTRKRRKIQTECDLQGGETRWHKTGKTRPVMASGKQKGCKKILVLYTNFGKNRKPEKTNWVMHQYHLGQSEEEREGELVVSKIFYQTQPRQCNWRESSAATAEGSGEASSRRESGGGGGGGGGSCSSKEIVIGQRDEVSASNVGGLMASYNSAALDMQQLKAQHFGFHSFRRSSFDEIGVGEASNVGDQSRVSGTCDEMTSHVPNEHQQHQQQQQQQQQHHHQQQQQQQQHHHQQQQQQQQHHHQIATTTFHNISRPSNPISTIISPPPNLLHTSINILDHDHDSFHVQRMMLQNETFQQHQQQLQQQQQQQHHKIGGRSASGLEELIMGCTSTHDHVKDESPITNPQEADWMKYSTFWPDPDHPDHHG